MDQRRKRETRLAITVPGAVIFGFIIILVSVIYAARPADSPQPSVSNPTAMISGQSGVWERWPQGDCVKAGVPIPTACLDGYSSAERDAMTCPAEDGRQDGIPCVWIKPSTQELFFINGDER